MPGAGAGDQRRAGRAGEIVAEQEAMRDGGVSANLRLVVRKHLA